MRLLNSDLSQAAPVARPSARRRALAGVFAALLIAAPMVIATPVSVEAAHKKHVKKAKAAPAASPASLDARHKVCLDFIQRHGQSCDPWVQPTCGYDIGYMRPMECVAP